ncbi:MAG: hypothetical protein JNK89_09865, partial [Saprospiraceae bacterium]|nr:hypothetical protein [Saprospiraceae bacterium]
MHAYQTAECIELVHSGTDFFDRLLRMIAEARHSVQLQTYIFDGDATGQLVVRALEAAARRGVRVRVLVDGFGSKNFPPALARSLREAGVEFRFFKHLISFWNWRFGRTLHHKVAVVDAEQAMVGGINIADKYRGSDLEAAWLDFAVYFRGGPCAGLAQLCDDTFDRQYWRSRGQRRHGRMALLPEGERAGWMRFRLNDWMRRKTEVYQSYVRGISAARQSLTITASYFLPGRSVRSRLKAAVRRGVEVRVLLTGPSDVGLSRLAEQFLSHWMLRRGIRVFVWEKSVMHGKAMLVDRQWSSLGSYNIN